MPPGISRGTVLQFLWTMVHKRVKYQQHV